MPPRWTAAEEEWLRREYPSMGLREAARERHDELFPATPRSLQSIAVKANKMGLHVTRAPERARGSRRCARVIRWSKEPEMDAWMSEHDRDGIRTAALADAFEGRFGFRPTQTQISAWRSLRGRQTKRGCGRAQDWHRAPVGAERDTGKGYVAVKVAEEPTRPGSKDNWRPRHHIVWEEANGRPIPEGCVVMAGDRDCRSTDPDNLVLVPKALVGVINSGSCGEYRDGPTLRAVAAAAALKHKVAELEMRPRRCWRCGREFAPSYREGANVRTCPECVAAGHKAPRRPSGFAGEAACDVCGKVFARGMGTQRRCPDCIRRYPKASIRSQRRAEGME